MLQPRFEKRSLTRVWTKTAWLPCRALRPCFGFARVSLVLKEVVKDIRGRLVVFFPGEFEDNNYRLLDARDGWNYLAVAITLHNGVSD